MTETIARYKPRGNRLVASCGRRDVVTHYCPGRVAEVGRDDSTGAWVARPPVGWWWRKRDGVFHVERSHIPNRGDPDPEKRYLPRKKGGHVEDRALIGSISSIAAMPGYYPRVPVRAECNRGHANIIAEPDSGLVALLLQS